MRSFWGFSGLLKFLAIERGFECDLQSLALWQFLGDLVNKKTWSLKAFI